MNLSVIGLLILSVGGAAVLAVLAGWIPTLTAIRQDPADVLREE
jgi:ABC-type lipoprotein release transport system permease subunit